MNNQEIQQIKKARKPFYSVALAYSLGLFNDNFFKQSVMLLALSIGMKQLQGYAVIIFTLPYLIATAPAGWLADRFSKRKIIMATKFLEFFAMLIGAGGLYLFSPNDSLYSISWILILTMMGIMGLQSSLFSPSLNGSIPEIYPEAHVGVANGILKTITTFAILGGLFVPGMILNGKPNTPYTHAQLMPVAITIILTSFFGFFFSLGAAKTKAAGSTEKFPWSGPVKSVKDLISIKKDKLLNIAVWASTFFWFAGPLQAMLINEMAIKQFGWAESYASYLLVIQMGGIAIGALLVGRYAKGKTWYRAMLPSLLLMALAFIGLNWVPAFPEAFRFAGAAVLLALAGLGGGLFLIPLDTYIQVHPKSDEKGKVIAAANFINFIGSVAAGALYILFTNLKFKATNSFLTTGYISVGVFCLIFLVVFHFENSHEMAYRGGKKILDRILVLLGKVLIRFRYKIKIKGLKSVPKKKDGRGILFLPNHTALTDPILVISAIYNRFVPRSLAIADNLSHPIVSWMTQRLGVLKMPDISVAGLAGKEKVQEVFDHAKELLANGSNVLMYPAGRLKRQSKEIIGANSGVKQLLDAAPDSRVVLVRHNGLWGSSFSWGQGRPHMPKNIFRKILSNFFFFMPRRKVEIELFEANDFPVNGSILEQNTYLENFYNENNWPNSYVPYSHWEKEKRHTLPEPKEEDSNVDVNSIPENVKNTVYDYLKKETGEPEISPEKRLAYDMGMDSLAVAEAAAWIAASFGVVPGSTDEYIHVSDLLALAAGEKESAGILPEDLKASEDWLKISKTGRVVMPDGKNLMEAFLNTAAKNPSRTIMGDLNSGEKKYRDLILGSLALNKVIKKQAGDRLGLMFPASVGAGVFYYATLFAGKTPVMVNWTTGTKNIKASLSKIGVKAVITSKQLITKLEAQGMDFSEIEEFFVFAEDLGKSISIFTKIKALLASHFSWSKLRRAAKKVQEDDPAVILFTSGSENLPKAVPLTHKNLLANVNDLQKFVTLNKSERMLGMLPPFHSFGLTATTILPLTLNMQIFFYPNPTEGQVLAKLTEVFKITLMVSTPSFLKNIVQGAEERELDSLRLVVTGAEKCPDSLYEQIQKLCPHTLILEGYGVTECSPVISINDEKAPVKGSIGKILPSLEKILLHPENSTPVAQGEQGLLLVSGPSVFNGYMNYEGDSPFVELNGKKWYQTGDIVVEDKNGVITFSGRKKRFIKIGGEMISLPAMEEALRSHLETEDYDGPEFAVEAGGSEEAPVITLFTIREVDRLQLNRLLRESGFSPLYQIKEVKVIEEIPVLGTGKTNYRELKALL